MTDLEGRPRTYRFGYRLGQLTRVYLVVFAGAVAGVLLGATSIIPEPWRVVVLVVSSLMGILVLVVAAVTRRNLTGLFIGTYILLVAGGSVLQGMEPRPTRALLAVAIGSIVAAIGFVVSTLQMGRRNKELDRLLFSESTSIAFFITMLGAITYALLEVWIDAPKLSMWFVWTVGMAAWVVLNSILRRRYS